MHKKLTEYLGSAPLGAMDMENAPSSINGAVNAAGTSAMGIAAADLLEDAYTCGECCAKEGFAAGMSWAYGPVADLIVNPKNPIINVRSWGDDADKTGDFVSAFEKDGKVVPATVAPIFRIPSPMQKRL